MDKFECFLQEIKNRVKIFNSTPFRPASDLTIQLNNPEALMLQLVSKYNEQTNEGYVKATLQDAMRCELEAIMDEKFFKAWMEQEEKIACLN